MKKILVVILVAFASVTSSFAINSNEYAVISKLNTESTFKALVRYLNTDEDQTDQLRYIFYLTERKLNSALKSNNEAGIEKAMWFNIGNAKYVLTPEQYKKFLVVINISLYRNDTDFLAEK